MKNSLYILFACFALLASSCASPYLKGTTPSGEKIYLGPTPITNTQAFKQYLHTSQKEGNKINYLFSRLQEGNDLVFYRDGAQYDSREVYKGGRWLFKNRYKSGNSARDFIKNHIWYSEETGRPYYVEAPDGSFHIGYYILINELNLLEETASKIK